MHIYIYVYIQYICIYLGVHKSPPWQALMSDVHPRTILQISWRWDVWRFSWRKWCQKRKCLSGHWSILNHLRKIPIIQKVQRTPASYKIDFLPMSWQCFPMWKLWISELNPKCPKPNLDIKITSCMEFTKHFEPWQIWNLNRHPLQLAILERLFGLRDGSPLEGQ